MKYIIILTLLFFINCASSNRAMVEAEAYPKPDFRNLVDQYISTDKSAQNEDPNVIIIDPKKDEWKPPSFSIPLLEQPEIKESFKNFTCFVRGKVAVAILLDKNGDVLSPQLRRGIHPLCDAKALDIAKKAKITPARLDGKPIAMVVTLPISFK